MTGRNIFIFKSIDGVSEFVAEKWKNVSEEAAKKRGVFTVALSGGKTPEKLYQKLAKSEHDLGWDKTHFFLVDERFVPAGDPDSNFGMIDKRLLRNAGVPVKNIHRIHTEEGLEKSSELYAEDIARLFNLKNNELPAFDLILLGIGEDGHTASVFPDADFKPEKKGLVLVVHHKKTGRYRISLSLPVLNNARNIMFIVTGKRKKRILREILEKKSMLPAALVKPKSGNLYFLLDRASSRASTVRVDHGKC